jgi:trans-aconitate methyltransferase
MAFAAIAAAYELLADPTRLERELPFLSPWCDGGRVLDLACGTGEHLAGLARRRAITGGVGVDLEPGMAERARQRHPDPRLQFRTGDLRTATLTGFSHILLLGNAANCLASADDLTGLAARVPPGTRLLVQVANAARPGPDHACVVRRRDDAIAVKTVVHADARSLLTVTLHQRTAAGWTSATDHQALLRLRDDDLCCAVAHFRRVRLLGGLDGAPYDAQHSPDCVLDAER